VKKPKNGGTPAIENRSIVILKTKKGLKLNSFKEYNVLKFVNTILKKFEKKIMRVRL
jgi:hypothetical protein